MEKQTVSFLFPPAQRVRKYEKCDDIRSVQELPTSKQIRNIFSERFSIAKIFTKAVKPRFNAVQRVNF